VRRLPEGTPAHDAFRASIDMLSGITPGTHWKRNPGRPRHTWVRRVLADVQLRAQEAWTAAGDRVEWRALQSSADYAIWWWWYCNSIGIGRIWYCVNCKECLIMCLIMICFTYFPFLLLMSLHFWWQSNPCYLFVLQTRRPGEGSWPWSGSQVTDNSHYRYCLSAVPSFQPVPSSTQSHSAKRRERCVGFVRRRIGRGGRCVLMIHLIICVICNSIINDLILPLVTGQVLYRDWEILLLQRNSIILSELCDKLHLV